MPSPDVVAAGLDGLAVDEIDLAPKDPAEGVLQVEEIGEGGAMVGGEGDEQVDVAFGRVEIVAAGGGAEDVQTGDREAADRVGCLPTRW